MKRIKPKKVNWSPDRVWGIVHNNLNPMYVLGPIAYEKARDLRRREVYSKYMMSKKWPRTSEILPRLGLMKVKVIKDS